MDSVTAADSTPIAYERTGEGPPLVLVHGAASHHIRWDAVRPPLEAHFTVYAVDRRGRGGSGDTEPYAIEREFEDVAAVVDAIDEPVYLLGHSFGALCALEATLLTDNVRTLVLYEPPVPGVIELAPADVIDDLESQLAAGDREGVLTTFLREVAQLPAAEVDLLRAEPAWTARVAAAHTIPRELRGGQTYRFDPARFAGLDVPVVLLRGEESPTFMRACTEAVHEALPDSRIVVLAGQQHVAMSTAPELFVETVVDVLAATA